MLSPTCFRELHGSNTKFRRLTLGDTSRMTSLDFWRECRVIELLFNPNSFPPGVTDIASFYVMLSQMLPANPRLSFLEIKVPQIAAEAQRIRNGTRSHSYDATSLLSPRRRLQWTT
ncbi:hypothetical protein V5799_027149 [Amblyomma americanum]|uniref:Uncharacterized protein n=1 Tax=Amblyomma americanum TaxID=6943 RepID=A0AAQ4DGJ2_AMBAM